ncbi:MAG: hypothetical protein HY296_06545 [Thaumarchaeota archaeon]|nr:hypothetical protein [Nitrososphaerota archaeon]
MQGKQILLFLTIASIFMAIVVGAYVTVAGFGDKCGTELPRDWPGCLGGAFPPLELGPVAEYMHRILAALSTLLLFVTTALYLRDPAASTGVRRTLIAASILLFAQVLLGGAVIVGQEEALLVAAHQGLAVFTFGLAVAALSLQRRQT